jgi:hypothetical protein
MRYLLALGIVTAQPTLHLRDSTLAGEAVQVEIELRMRYLLALGIVKEPLQYGTPLGFLCAGISKQSMGARNRVGIGLSYRPAKLHRLAELIP